MLVIFKNSNIDKLRKYSDNLFTKLVKIIGFEQYAAKHFT